MFFLSSPVHLYTLSDNRHYTFYIWKNIFAKYADAKYYAIPFYVFSFWFTWDNCKFWILKILFLKPQKKKNCSSKYNTLALEIGFIHMYCCGTDTCSFIWVSILCHSLFSHSFVFKSIDNRTFNSISIQLNIEFYNNLAFPFQTISMARFKWSTKIHVVEKKKIFGLLFILNFVWNF